MGGFMTEKRFEAVCELGKAPYLVDYSAKYVNSNGVELTIKRTFQGDYNVESSDSNCIYFANLLNHLHEENEQLKQQNQEYKNLLQDMGMLMSDNEVVSIRNEISDKFLKPLFESNGFDVDIDTTDGFKIIPKGDVE